MNGTESGERIGYSPEVGWDRWEDGRVFTLYRVGAPGTGDVEPSDTVIFDAFVQPATQARRAFLSWASRRGVSTHSKVVDESVLKVQVVPRRTGPAPRTIGATDLPWPPEAPEVPEPREQADQ